MAAGCERDAGPPALRPRPDSCAIFSVSISNRFDYSVSFEASLSLPVPDLPSDFTDAYHMINL